MPHIYTSVFISGLNGFRPCEVTYEAPKFGEVAHFTVLSIKDKYPPEGQERVYDLEKAVANNNFDKLIGEAQAKAMAEMQVAAIFLSRCIRSSPDFASLSLTDRYTVMSHHSEMVSSGDLGYLARA